MNERDRVEQQVLAVLNAHALARRQLHPHLGRWLHPDLILLAVRGRDGRQTRRRSVERACARLCADGLVEAGLPGFRVSDAMLALSDSS